ncbi:MAG: hypothetical protein WAV45_11175 [Propionibacteriaceae bacterium]|nr:hypothetical protein [Micropruina sp.]HBX79731.1 hypothetical protein [Propionibacteriaceae bacterium]HBY24622.1 hypothetical protein [Propionibacteriaceae bacterium]
MTTGALRRTLARLLLTACRVFLAGFVFALWGAALGLLKPPAPDWLSALIVLFLVLPMVLWPMLILPLGPLSLATIEGDELHLPTVLGPRHISLDGARADFSDIGFDDLPEVVWIRQGRQILIALSARSIMDEDPDTARRSMTGC